MYIKKEFVGDFEPTKLNNIFGRTIADIENLIKEGELFNLLDLEKLHATLKDCVHIEGYKAIFNKPANWNEGFVPKIQLLVTFLNKQFDASNLYLVSKYEIEFFEMLAEM